VLTINKPIVGSILLSLCILLSSGCTTVVEKKVEVMIPCIEASKLPPIPSYLFDTLPLPVTAKDEAEAVKTLYLDFLLAQSHADVLSYLVQPCLGMKGDKDVVK